MVGGQRPLLSEICAQSDPPPLKNADLDRFPLLNHKRYRDKFSYEFMTNRKSTTGFPMSYRWSAPKGG